MAFSCLTLSFFPRHHGHTISDIIIIPPKSDFLLLQKDTLVADNCRVLLGWVMPKSPLATDMEYVFYRDTTHRNPIKRHQRDKLTVEIFEGSGVESAWLLHCF